jgi:ParB family chromosome partitioning protein
MHVPWSKSKPLQLDLLNSDPAADKDVSVTAVIDGETTDTDTASIPAGIPLMLPTTSLFEDPNNPRTEFPHAELEELAEDVRQHGILQPIVVHPVNATGRHQIHFGAKRCRAAQIAELEDVPVVVRDAPADSYRSPRTRSAMASRQSTWRDSSAGVSMPATPTPLWLGAWA